MPKLKTYWLSWWTWEVFGYNLLERPFKCWRTGYRIIDDVTEEAELSFCACVQAKSEKHAWEIVQNYWAVNSQRFCDEKEKGWQPPPERFGE